MRFLIRWLRICGVKIPMYAQSPATKTSSQHSCASLKNRNWSGGVIGGRGWRMVWGCIRLRIGLWRISLGEVGLITFIIRYVAFSFPPSLPLLTHPQWHTTPEPTSWMDVITRAQDGFFDGTRTNAYREMWEGPFIRGYERGGWG